LQTGCLEEIAVENGWISAKALRTLAEPLQKNGYGVYLLGLLD
jgi:glucose-1-phosphate thymidylyltransferase